MSEALFVDLYELTMAQVYFNHKREAAATFDLFIRSAKRPFYVAAGIDDALNYLCELRFTAEDIDYLRSLAIFEDDFLDYLKNFKFRGDLWGVEEPEIIFPNEPIIRVSANLIEAQIIESALINRVNLATTLATKAARVVLAAKSKGVYDFSLRRAQGKEAALACAKYSYIAGAKGTSNVLAGSLYKIPVIGTMAHSFVMSFDKEIDSFLAFTLQFPAKSILLVDTYDVKKGINSAIRVAKSLKKRGCQLLGLRLDSGDLAHDARYARGVLDQQGLIDAVIFASGDLDEYRITQLIKANAPIDAFGVGTKMGCAADIPYSDIIYKLVEIKEKGKKFIPTMKLSEGKTTLPARKQLYRIIGSDEVMTKDVITLDKETHPGKKLLKKLVARGQRCYRESTINEKRKIFAEKLTKLPEPLKDVSSKFSYPLTVSPGLTRLTRSLKGKIKKRKSQNSVFVDIDTQNDFIEKKGALYVKGAEKLIPKIKKLTKFAAKNDILIISSQDSHARCDPEFKQFPPHCVRGSWGRKKIAESLLPRFKELKFKNNYASCDLRRFAGNYPQIVLDKNVINVFTNPNTLALFEVIFPETVYLYGLVTEFCVKEAVEELIKHGFSLVIVNDATKEISPNERKALFSSWRRRGVKFTTSDKLLRSKF